MAAAAPLMEIVAVSMASPALGASEMVNVAFGESAGYEGTAVVTVKGTESPTE